MITLLLLLFSFNLEKKAIENNEVVNKNEPIQSNFEQSNNYPISIKISEAIDKYATEYDIPLKYAYGIAYYETRYRGPFHYSYNQDITSYAGAVGPMQIMPSTGNFLYGKKIDKTELKMNVDLNVKLSMKYLRILHNRYGDWRVVFGCYNTGRPLINDYAMKVYNYNFQHLIKP